MIELINTFLILCPFETYLKRLSEDSNSEQTKRCFKGTWLISARLFRQYGWSDNLSLVIDILFIRWQNQVNAPFTTTRALILHLITVLLITHGWHLLEWYSISPHSLQVSESCRILIYKVVCVWCISILYVLYITIYLFEWGLL